MKLFKQKGNLINYFQGLGNVWRFPFLVFKNGGAAFLVPFFILLFLVGVPFFFLETAIGQFSGMSPNDCFFRMCPIFQGLGYAAVAVNVFIGFYYNVIIAYCIYYLVYSFNTEVPWKNCHGEPDCFKRSNFSMTCDEEMAIFKSQNITETRSPSEVYF